MALDKKWSIKQSGDGTHYPNAEGIAWIYDPDPPVARNVYITVEVTTAEELRLPKIGKPSETGRFGIQCVYELEGNPNLNFSIKTIYLGETDTFPSFVVKRMGVIPATLNRNTTNAQREYSEYFEFTGRAEIIIK